MKVFNLFFLWTLALVSCQNNEVINKKYFDMDGLIDTQVNYLVQSRASITKSASVDTANDISTFIPNEESWSNELAVFRHLELINKPIYKEAYKEIDGIKDSNSNLTLRILNAKVKVPVKQFKIYYQNNPERVRKIEASIIEENALYYSSRKFSIELDDHQDNLVLSKYTIQGVQKMILRDSVRFSISATINY
jgi:hypothetical protein